MIKDTIGNIFDFIPETNLTEEYFYEHKGEYPVFSGQTENEGIIAYIDGYNQTEPCVTFTTYGVNAGTLNYREGKYTIGRNCMGLRPKEKFKDKIILEWFIYRYQNLFYKSAIGDKNGQKSLNKILIKGVEITIPNKNIQRKQLRLYQRALSMVSDINNLLSKLNNLLNSKIKINLIAYEEEIGNIFHFKGGNSGLTEEFVYYNQSTSEDDKIPILSSATIETNFMGYISKNAKPQGKKLKIFKGPCILVARNGYAGKMTYISESEFTTNDHAYVLVPKEEWKNEINLRWFVYQYQELFFNLVTSKSDNATFNKEYAKKQKVKIPDKENYQDKIAKMLLKIDELINKLEYIKEQIYDLIETEII